MKRAVLITPDADVRPVPIFNEERKLDILQAAVGGYIEVVRNHAFEDTMTVFCDGDGLRKKLPVNVLATELFDNGGGLGPLPIVGNVVVTGRTTEKGDTLGLTITRWSPPILVGAATTHRLTGWLPPARRRRTTDRSCATPTPMW